MEFNSATPMPRWAFIATPRTNLCRQHDSDAGSKANMTLQESMAGTNGWSQQFPHVAVSMKNWPFEQSDIVPNGCTAQEQVDEENAARATALAAYEKDTTDEGRLVLETFKAMFCNKKGVLHKLTIENSYWTHSGHQRMEYVFFPAAVLQQRRIRDNDVLDAEDRLVNLSWSNEVPTLIGTYTDLQDILRDQLKINTNASQQNKLNIFDYFKNAVIAIGNGPIPLIYERAFRKLCETQGLDGAKASSGQMPRWAFLLAEINYAFSGRLHFYKHITAPQKVESGKETIINPDWIDINEVALEHEDPMCNVAVICRLIEPNLKKLKDYIKNNGALNADVASGKKPDLVSAIEYEIAGRGKDGLGESWSFEEALAWMNSKFKGRGVQGGYRAPKITPKPEPFKLDKLKGPIESERLPMVTRMVLAKYTGMPTKLGVAIDQNADLKAQELKGPLDTVWSLSVKDTYEKMLVDTIGELGNLKDGSRQAFDLVVPQLRDLVEKAMSGAGVTN